MPDLGKAYVQIIPSAEGISGSITKVISGEATSAGEAGGELLGAGLLKKFAAAGTAVAVGKLLLNGIKESVSGYADYEQLTGGVETLFKDSADMVKEYAENAYKTAGLSANEYMDTVTSFSASLLQSLGGDTRKAAEKADQAITDMADNANKMGTSMESVQNAYQGFAKQNYTMLDNLKLGYGGTKEEMERLLEDAEKLSGIHYDISSYADIVDAIHVVQKEMGIAGTTSKEAATTIEGSMNTAKASWNNLLVGISSGGSNLRKQTNEFANSVITATDNIVPAVSNTVSGFAMAIGGLLEEVGSRFVGIDSDTRSLSIALEGTTQSADAERESIEANSDAAFRMISTLDGLISKEQKTAIEKEQIAQQVDVLNEMIPGLNAEYDKMTDSLNMSSEAMREFVLTSARTAALSSYQDELSELYRQQFEALSDVAQKTTEAEEATRIYNDTFSEQLALLEAGEIQQGTYGAKVGMAESDMIAANHALEQSQTHYDSVTESIGQLEGMLTGYSDLLGETETNTGSLSNSTEQLSDKLSEEEAAAQQAHDSLVEIIYAAHDAMSSGEDLSEAYEKLSKEFDSAKESGDEVTAGLARQKLAQLQLAATNQKLANGFPAIVSRLDGFGISLTQTSAWLVDNGLTAEDWGNQVNSATDNVINGFNELDTSLDMSLEEMAANMQSNIESYANWNQNIADLMQGAMSITDESSRNAAVAFVQHMQEMGVGAADQVAMMKDNMEWTFSTFGPMMGDAIDQGMISVYNGIEGADLGTPASGIMDDATAAVAAADFASPGQQKSAQLASGMAGNSYMVTAAASAVVSTAQNGAYASASSFTDVGYAMDAGMAQGLYSGMNIVIKAAREVARQAYQAAKQSLGINSPSKVFRDKIGAGITEGLALGIERNTDLVTKSMKGLTEATVGTFRISGLERDPYALGARGAYGGAAGSYSNVVNVTVNGAESPEEYANRLARQLQMQMRMV